MFYSGGNTPSQTPDEFPNCYDASDVVLGNAPSQTLGLRSREPLAPRAAQHQLTVSVLDGPRWGASVEREA